MDEFTRLNRQLGKQLSDIRNMIAERDDLLSQALPPEPNVLLCNPGA